MDSTATWQGVLSPGPRQYDVQAFIPRQLGPGVPRTLHAHYLVYTAFSAGPTPIEISQQVNVSQWVDLGTFTFDGSYEVVLVDETGEPSFSHDLVANAIGLAPQ